MKNLTKEEFEEYHEIYVKEFYDHWRLLDIDFETYMIMRGLSKQEYNKLNNEKIKITIFFITIQIQFLYH